MFILGRYGSRSVALALGFLALMFADAGIARPGDTETWTEDGTWAFNPAQRLEGGMLDLRYLNEQTAGLHGFVRLSEDGDGFVRGDDVPIRFWGVAPHVGPRVSDEDLARHARFLARVGVNMVRVGGASSGLMPQEEGAAITDVNEDFLDTVWRTVAAMKKEGIYTRISPFWDHGSVKYIDPDWGIEGYSSGDSVNGLLFFEPTLQKGYRAWMRRLMTEPNPYTGIPLKDDPAVAIVQIVSEDSLLFWWFDRIKGGPRRELETRFAGFARERYGGIDEALAAWGSARVEGDAPEQGRLGLYPMYELTQWPPRRDVRRLRDQTEFMARLERGFYVDMRSYLTGDLGVRQLISPSNFHSADPVRLDGAQRWAWTAGDVIELNDFFGGVFRGQHSSWRIQPGQFFTRRSAVRTPDLPAACKQVAGHPFIVSSTNWVPPNLYTTEGPVMTGAYAAMSGVDGLMWFAAQAPAYDLDPYFRSTKVQGSHPMKRWSISHPGFISQFPAAALIYRQGLVEPAATVVHERRSLDELFERNPPLLTDSPGYDPAEHADEAAAAKRQLMEKVSPEAYLVGRVEVEYDEEPAGSRVVELDPYVDQAAGRVRAMNGQLILNRKRGVLRIDSARAQGVVGFLSGAGGNFELSDVTIASGNEYAVVVAVALDEAPLASSRRILVQFGTTARPTGWEVRPATREIKGESVEGHEILSTGEMPWRVRNADVQLTVRNPTLTRATLLDEMGFAVEHVPLEVGADGVRLNLPPNTLYALLSGPEARQRR